VDEMEFQLRRQELVAVQRCEAEKIRQQLEMERETQALEESSTSDDVEDRSPQVS